MCSISVHKTYTDQVLVKKYIYRNVQNFTLTYKTFIKQLKFLFLAISLLFYFEINRLSKMNMIIWKN